MIRLINSVLGIVLQVCSAVVIVFFDAVAAAVPPLKKQEYDAGFGKVDAILNKNRDGIYIGSWCTTLEQAFEHGICFGGSGTGKSSCITTPIILNTTDVSLVVHSPSKDELNTAAYKKHQGHNVLVLDYTNPQASEGINVLALCNTDADVYLIAKTHVKNTMPNTVEDFWAESAISLLMLLMNYVIHYAPKEEAHMTSVYHLLNVFSYNPQAVDKLIAATKDEQLLEQYKSIIATPSKTLLSVVATAKTALAIYTDKSVQQVTSFNTIDFAQFRNEKTILYICHSASKADYYGVLTACLFELFWSYLLSEQVKNNARPIFFLIDEASSMYLQSLPQTVALARKQRVSISLIYQDYNQLVHQYGNYNASNILANTGTRVFMKNQPLETCQMLERLLGKFTYVDEKETKRTRELMTAHEIRELNRTIVLVSNKPALLLKPQPFFLQKKLLKRTQLPAYKVPNKLPFETVPILSIPR